MARQDPEDAIRFVQDWLAPEVAWVPMPGPGHGALFADLVVHHQIRGNLVSDAHLAALAIEHGLTLCSADSDFARFPELTWRNPLQG